MTMRLINPDPPHGELRRLPGETALAYQAFVAYATLESSGHANAYAAVTDQFKVHPKTVYRWSSKHHWRNRLAMANCGQLNASLEAAAAVAKAHAKNWEERREHLRQVEWQVHTELIAAARQALAEWQASGQLTRPAEIARMLELASRLGRLAAGLPSQTAELTGADGGPIQIDIEAALRKVYGTPEPAEVTDVEAELLDAPSASAPDTCPLTPDP